MKKPPYTFHSRFLAHLTQGGAIAFCLMCSLLLLPGRGAGQVLFSDNFEVDCPDAPCQGVINNQCLPLWAGSHGTPQIRADLGTGNRSLCMIYASMGLSEGAFRTLPPGVQFEPCTVYEYTIRIRTVLGNAPANVRYEIALTNGLQPAPLPQDNESCLGALPQAGPAQIIFSEPASNFLPANGWKELKCRFVPTQAFTQLWIYSTGIPTILGGFCIDDLQVNRIGPATSPTSTFLSVDATPTCRGSVVEVAYRICQTEALQPTTFTVSANLPGGFSLASGYSNPVSFTSASPATLCYYNGGMCVDIVFRFVVSSGIAPDTYVIPLQVQENNACLSGWTEMVEIKVVDCPVPEYSCECPAGYPVFNIFPLPERNYNSLRNLLIQSALPAQGVSGACLRIKGQFFVNADYTLDNCLLLMEPGAEILMDYDKALSISGSELRGCDAMWRGIKMLYNAGGGSTLVINGSTLSDAQYAVYVSSHTFPVPNLFLVNNRFDNNLVGLYVPGSSAGSSINSLVIVNRFTQSSHELLPPYPGQSNHAENLPEQNGKALAGIIINGIPSFHSIKNAFSGLTSGIIARNAAVVSSHDSWEHVRMADEYPAWEFGGKAVSMVSTSGMRAGTVERGLFSRCDQGIMSNNYQLTVRNNTMNQTDVGVFAGLNWAGDIIIEDNLMRDALWGVLTAHVNPHGKVEVNRNEIATATENAKMGIASIFSIAPTRISRNKIVVTYTGSGIGLWASSKVITHDNQVSLLIPQKAQYGMDIQNTPQSLFGFNTVTGGGTSGPDNIALRIASSPGNLYCCNTLTNTRIGAYIAGGSLATQNFRGTHFSKHHTSLLLQNQNALLGSQTHKQNCWGPGAGPAVYGEGVPVPLNTALQYPFVVDPTINSCFMPAAHTPAGWFQDEPDFDIENVCNSEVCVINEFLPESDDVKRLAIGDTTIAPAVLWELQRYLYARLQGQELQSPVIRDFVQRAESSSIGAFYRIETELTALMQGDEWLNERLRANLQTTQERQERIGREDAEFSLLQPSGNWLRPENRTLQLEEISRIASENAEIAKEQQAQRRERAEVLAEKNKAIVPETDFEANEQSVNDLYLQYIAENFAPLQPERMEHLQSIARQCPFIGGNAVYRARAFWTVLTGEMPHYNDEAACADPPALRMPEQSAGAPAALRGFTVFPNPTNDELRIQWKEAALETGEARIFDLYGRLVQRSVIATGATENTMSLHRLSDGLYYLNLHVNGMRLVRRIVVQH